MKMPRVYTFDVPDFDDCGGRTMRRVEVPKRTFREIEADVAAPLEAVLAASAARVQALEGVVARLCEAICAVAEAREVQDFEALLAAISDAENEAVISAEAIAHTALAGDDHASK